MEQLENQVKQKMEASLEHFKQELKNLRTNRANPGMVEGILIEAYGSQMKLKELASITTPDARQILITPFDPQTAGVISKGIEKANLGLNPKVDGHAVRITLTPMSEAIRRDIVKAAKQKVEDAKVTIRNIRREFYDLFKKQKKNQEITEDVVKKLEKSTQDLTDNFCKQIDSLFAIKEKEIMAV